MSAKLSLRLTEIIRLCGTGRTVADIGCDHAFVCIKLIEENAFEKAIAMDIRSGPLAAAGANIRSAGLEDHIETRLSDGLEELKPGEADTVLIAGMGGDLIMRIIGCGMDRLAGINRLVLGPQSHVPEVRAFLHENGFRITDESFIRDDGKYYSLLCACRGKAEEYTETELAFGKYNLVRRDKTMEEWLSARTVKLESIIGGLKNNPTKQASERMQELTVERALTEAALRQIRSE